MDRLGWVEASRVEQRRVEWLDSGIAKNKQISPS